MEDFEKKAELATHKRAGLYMYMTLSSFGLTVKKN
jgi:hypothetical protein